MKPNFKRSLILLELNFQQKMSFIEVELRAQLLTVLKVRGKFSKMDDVPYFITFI